MKMDDLNSSHPVIESDNIRPRSMSDPGPGPLCTSERFFELIKEGISKTIEKGKNRQF